MSPSSSVSRRRTRVRSRLHLPLDTPRVGRVGEWSSRKLEAEFRPSARSVVGGEGGVLVFEEAFRDRESEPGSAVGTAGGGGSADAGLEDVWEEVGVDS